MKSCINLNNMEYTTKDSGKRTKYESGFQRDTKEGKPRYDLIPGELLKRLAELYARGAEKYGDNNWRLANTEKEFHHFKECAWRHFMQWANNWDEEEDHGIACAWNIFAYIWLTEYKNVHKQKAQNRK